MADVPPNYTPKAGGKPENILLAYGLTIDQEKTFAADPRAVSAFWNVVDDKHDHIFMDQRNNNRQGNSFSAVNSRDATLLVKAAHSARGLYLYFEVTDNMFLIRLNSWGFFSRTFRAPLNNNINSSSKRLWIITAE